MADNLIENFLLNQAPGNAVLKKTLDANALRQRTHAQNIANAETPGYRRLAVDFEQQLKQVLDDDIDGMAQTNPRHMNGNGARVELEALAATTRTEPLDPNSPGINGVNIDLEMAEMAETQLRYLTSLELLKRRYAGIKAAIKGQP
ncbi:flagellar basal body rod protein FlgB [candidate division KSB1 bacterium]|nr:flagellar basal body rod protein FlgB [candidate division KSB1 bacterium]